MKKITFIFLSFLCSLTVFSQQGETDPLVADYSAVQKEWVENRYNQMTLEEKVGQLFIAQIYSGAGERDINYIKSLVKDYHIGGIIFSKGGPVRQARLTNELQEISKIPLLMSQDAEWGLAMRLDSTYAFPWNMTLGAVEDNKLIERTGAQIAKHVKRMGMQMDFVPDVDININPENPIIGNRSFGENKERVTEKALALLSGFESEGVLTSAKHFPGHGDTNVDSHKALPVLNFSKERLDSIELYPYKKLIAAGIPGVMVGHLEVPALDARKGTPASVSYPVITELLKEKLNFKGLVLTDALDMKGVKNDKHPEQTGLDALLAGNDILLMPGDVPANIKVIIQACKDGKVSEERLAHSVKKILMAKYKTGLNNYKPVDLRNLTEDLNSVENDVLYEELMENAITVVKNNMSILPVKDLEKERIAYVHLGADSGDAFYETLKKYTKVDKINSKDNKDLLGDLAPYSLVIVGFHQSDASPWAAYKFKQEELQQLYDIAKAHRTVLNVFTKPYALLDVKYTSNIDAVVVSYQNSFVAQSKTAQILFGALGAKGKLPVSAGKEFPEGTGYKTATLQRLSYGLPESVGMNSQKLKKIDSLAKIVVDKKMAPGMQVLVARKGKVIFQKNYGYHAYSKKLAVQTDDVYDLASMTKMLASLPLYMELVDQGKINLDMTLKEILPFLKNSNKADITLKEVLSHYGRLVPFINFYKKTLDDRGFPSPDYYRPQAEGEFNVKVADNLYMREDYKDSIYQAIADSDLLKKKRYVYSDFPFYLSKKFFDDYYHSDMDTLTQTHFYRSMGANRLGYLPLNRFFKNEVVPTEVDDYFRHQVIHGYVHDEGSAMLGGTSGHAGLFGNANDVAKMMQLYLNKGTYGGKRYFSAQTFDLFNTCYYCDEDIRRAIGFDKPQLEGEKDGPASEFASHSSFGHLGFTGTKSWADPEEDVLYVVLSNYVHPDRARKAFIREDIRIKVEEYVYEAIEKSNLGKKYRKKKDKKED